MFVQASSTIVLPVEIEYVNEDGTIDPRTLKCRFKRPSQKQIDDIFDRVNRGVLNDPKLLEEYFLGWTEDTKDVQGNLLENTPENREMVLDVHPTRPSVVRKFLSHIQGAKAKNS